MEKVLFKATSAFSYWEDNSPSYLNNMLISLPYENRTLSRTMRKALKASSGQKSASNFRSTTFISVDQLFTKLRTKLSKFV